MVRTSVLALALIAVAGCHHKPPAVAPVEILRTVEVKVPVPFKVAAPPELLAPYAPAALPVWVQPSDPKASSALTVDGERDLRALINDLLTRIAAWKAWATAP